MRNVKTPMPQQLKKQVETGQKQAKGHREKQKGQIPMPQQLKEEPERKELLIPKGIIKDILVKLHNKTRKTLR